VIRLSSCSTWMRPAALFLLALAHAAPGAAADAEAPPAAEVPPARVGNLMLSQGESLFVRHCASCHGTSGRGDGPAASALSTPPANLTGIAARRGGSFPAGDIASIIDGRFELPAHGTREMPIWGRRLGEAIAQGTEGDEVARGRIDLLVEYLQTIQEPPLPKE
jgi:mono/diheme cytochrome c family protein